MFASGDPGERAVVRPVLFELRGKRVFVAGHVHAYERFLKDGVHFLVSGGGGGPVRELGAGRHPDLYAGPRGFHYLRFRLDDGLRCDVMMLGPDGTWSRVDGF